MAKLSAILCAIAPLCAACHSQREVASQAIVTVDSVASSAHHRTLAVIDSLVRNIDFSFDSLKVNIKQPVEFAEAPLTISITATRGRVIDQRAQHRAQVEVFNRLDTVAYKVNAAETSTEQTSTVRAYSPPDGTKILALSILLIAAILYFRIRK